MKRKIYLTLTVVFALVFVGSTAGLCITLYRYRQADVIYSDLQYRFVTLNPTSPDAEQFPDDDAEDSPKPTVTAPISVDFDALMQENDDIVGWLYCEDTVINYPVVQSKDNEDYLHSDLSGNYLMSGTLFVDCRCGSVGTDQNYIIYGHNMKNSTMFGTLVKYKDQSYYNEHPILWYLTPDGDYMIELFAGMVTSADSRIYMTDLGDEQNFEDFLQDIKADSTFETDVAVGGTDNIVTLSTCSYEFGNARYVVFGKLTH